MKVISKKKLAAFSIIEMLVAIAIFSMIASVGVIAVLHANSMARLGAERTSAIFLAEEAFEAIHSIKRRSWNDFSAIDCSAGCTLDESTGSWELSQGVDNSSDFRRTVYINNAYRNATGELVSIGNLDENLKEVEVVMEWDFIGDKVNSFSTKKYIVHYEDPVFQSADILANWPFNEGVGTTTYSNSLAANINGADWTIGAIGSALSFDGIDDYVELSNAESLSINNQMTITAWVYPTDRSGGRIYVMKGTNPGTYNYQFGQYDRKLYFGTGDNDGEYVMSNNTIKIDEWQHVAVVVDGVDVKFFYNGSLKNSRQLDEAVSSVSGNLFFGSELGNNYFFEGSLDQVEIYSKVFTDQEILDKYNNESSLIITPKMRWRFDDASGTSAKEDALGLDANLIGNLTWSPGVSGTALNFDGNSSYLDLSSSIAEVKKLISSAGTLSFWTKIERKSGSSYLFHIYDPQRSAELRIEYNAQDPSYNDQLRFVFDSWSYRVLYTYQYMPVPVQADDGKWHYFVMTWDESNEMKIYVDGQAFGDPVDISSANWRARISEICLGSKCPGASGGNPTQFFKGQIDNLEFFDYELTETEILNKYNEFTN